MPYEIVKPPSKGCDNYGYALGIMKKDGTKRLNTKGNEFVQDLNEWIGTQTTRQPPDLGRVGLQELHRPGRAE